MRCSSIFLVISAAIAADALNILPRGDCSIKFDGEPDQPGTCQKTSDCTSQGFNKAGFCPGPKDFQCCAIKECSNGSAKGICQNTGDNACDGHFEANLCPGPPTVKCCLPGKQGGEGGSDDSTPPSDPPPSGSSAAANKLVDAAESQKGVDYVWGGGGCEGQSNGGFDCSGLTRYAVCQAGLGTIPRTAKTQYQDKKGKHIKRKDAQKGDLIFWGHGGDCPGSVSHVGIYVRPKEGTEGIMVNAARTGTPVREQEIWTSSDGTSICPDAVRYW